ncbi:hypothetical protein M378DRAFT_160576 [Amanita muscaria Koide BX008]|uniref:Uncharacterized protein n=1 Tax=Amanita muscaria (strain Koide BX008) TaxID=946122 RepID=A0A0C2XCL7_AMAMK|nr:hypothetical protein M378DRAFT_160576 [Amanita muscaria Koide BX008]
MLNITAAGRKQLFLFRHSLLATTDAQCWHRPLIFLIDTFGSDVRYAINMPQGKFVFLRHRA